MKALLCRELKGVDGLAFADLPDPEPAAGEVAVRVTHGALNFFDTLIISGKYQTKPELPFSPVGEIAGVVVRVGAGVTDWAPGQRVMAYLGYGGAREVVCVPAERLVAVPDGVTNAVASSLAITYGTAIHAYRDRGALAAGETVAVLGAAGGAGLAAVEIAKVMGARVIAVASSEEKLQVCRDHGADETVLSINGDLKDRLRTLTGGAGVDVVYDCVGGDLAESAFRALAWKGRYLVVGFASGEIPKLPLNLFLVKGASAAGVFWGEAVRRDPAGHRANMAFILDAVARGLIKPRIHAVVPFASFTEGLALLSRREVAGKVVIDMGGGQAT